MAGFSTGQVLSLRDLGCSRGSYIYMFNMSNRQNEANVHSIEPLLTKKRYFLLKKTKT